MWKFFRFNSRQTVPVAKANFQRYFLVGLFLFLVFGGLVFGLEALGFISHYELLLMLLIFVFFSTLGWQGVVVGRFLDIFPEKKISAFAIGLYGMFPFLNLPILYLCLTKDSRSPSPSWFPLISKKRYAVILFVFMFVQPLFFSAGFYSGGFVRYHAWLASPTGHKIAFVSYQAREVFRIKASLSEKSNLIKEIESSQKKVPFDSTGHILSAALVATDVVKKKKTTESQRSPATATKEAASELLDGMFHLERLKKQHTQPWFGYSPLVLLSPANMIEALILLLVEEGIDHKYRETMRKNLGEMITNFEEVAIKENYGAEYLKKIAYYKTELTKI